MTQDERMALAIMENYTVTSTEHNTCLYCKDRVSDYLWLDDHKKDCAVLKAYSKLTAYLNVHELLIDRVRQAVTIPVMRDSGDE